MKKRFLSLFLTAMIALLLIPTAAAQTGGAALEEWNYTVDEDTGTVTLTKYIGDADSVTVPAEFEVQGRTFGTVLASATVFRANTGLKSVAIGAGVGFSNNSMRLLFGDCTALTQVDLSAVDTSGVVDMSYLFYNCSALKAVDLSALDTGAVTTIRAMFSGCTGLSGLTGYENWDTSSLKNMSFAFNKFVSSVSASVRVTIDLSGWDLSKLNNSGWCFQNCRAQQILLPDNLAVISAGFLNHATRYEGTSFTVPAGVKKIGYAHTLYDFATNDLTEIRVAQGNTNYVAIDGVLYSADGKEMLAVPRNKPFENGVFEIPEGVDFLGELSFSRNYNIHTVILPDSYEIEYVPIYDDRYIVHEDTGNLNAGTNLSIAIYCYTGVTDYAVKDTNPRYASVDGIIYSKDMKHIVAVPARYNKAIDIPEGVTYWDREAMWADGSSTVDNLLANCSGVTIPSTMKGIADDQFEMLNRLYSNRKKTSNPFTITVAEGNAVFSLDENGFLCPAGTGSVITDQAAADAVIAKIDAIGVVEYTDACSAKITDARGAYNALTDAQKALVTNYETLTAAEARYAELKAAAEQATADQTAANAVIAKIDAIGEVEYTDTCAASIADARGAYNALTAAQKALVTNYETLTAAEARYAKLKAAAETPIQPDPPQSGNLCKWCGKPHTGFWGKIVGFFHTILYFWAHLFGRR